ncbi:hypothetical protein ACFQ0G_08415 [Streptomyces chiangmaiensis]
MIRRTLQGGLVAAVAMFALVPTAAVAAEGDHAARHRSSRRSRTARTRCSPSPAGTRPSVTARTGSRGTTTTTTSVTSAACTTSRGRRITIVPFASWAVSPRITGR